MDDVETGVVEHEMTDVETEIENHRDFQNAYIQSNSDFYQKWWDSMDFENVPISWNWAAFLFGLYWLGSRKMFGYLFTIIAGFTLFVLLIGQINPNILFYFPILHFGLFIFLGAYGNTLYRKHVNRKVSTALNQFDDPERIKRHLQLKGGTGFLGILIVGFWLLLGLAGYFVLDEGSIEQVSGGSYEMYPTVTIEEAFEHTFSNPKWTILENNSPYDVVQFEGIAMQQTEDGGAEPVDIEIRFILEKSSFELNRIKIGDEVLLDEDAYELFWGILESAEN